MLDVCNDAARQTITDVEAINIDMALLALLTSLLDRSSKGGHGDSDIAAVTHKLYPLAVSLPTRMATGMMKAIGSLLGEVAQSSSQRAHAVGVLVQFDENVSDLGLYRYQPDHNSLWLLWSDIERLYCD